VAPCLEELNHDAVGSWAELAVIDCKTSSKGLLLCVVLLQQEREGPQSSSTAQGCAHVLQNGKKEEELVGASPPALETLIQKHIKSKAG
jgi:hypothetical protein